MSGFCGYDEATVIDTAQADPVRAAERSGAILSDPGSSERDRALALWARGIARRELADLPAAENDLVDAEALADTIDPVLRARVALTLALVVMYRGDSARALSILSGTEPMLEGRERGHMMLQRGLVLHRSGDLVAARAEYERALAILEDDEVSIVRLNLNIAVLDVYEGRPDQAIDRLHSTVRRADAAGQAMLAAAGVHNLGFALAGAGDFVGALAEYDAAEKRFRRLGETGGRVAIVASDRAATLLDANLLREAHDDATEAMAVLRSAKLEVEYAEAALLAARIRLALGDLAAAADAAAAARESFAASDRTAWIPLIRLLETQIASRRESVDGVGFAREATNTAAELRSLRRHREADQGFLLAGRVLLDAGHLQDARAVLARVGEGRRTFAPVETAARTLARALVAHEDGDAAGARRAVSLGLRSLWQGRIASGHFELRAHAAAHAEELGRLGARLALEDGRAREFVRRIEASRAVANLSPVTRPPRSPEVASILTDLRLVTGRLRSTELDADEHAELTRRQRRLEREVARLSRGRAGSDPGGEIALAESITELGRSVLLFQFDLDGQTWSAVVRDGRASVGPTGEPGEWLRASADQHFALGRLQRRGLSDASAAAAHAALADTGQEVATLLPTPVVGSDRSLVVVPSSSTADVCWATMPGLTGRPLSVASSLAGWTSAVRARAGRETRSAVVVGGPGLEHAGTELDAIASQCGWPSVIRPATLDDLVAELGRCDVLHAACHGRFRSDNPLFSSLRLTDGDLNFYDLEQCERLPHTVVLSACNAGQHEILAGGVLLGMASALVQLGVSSVIAPLTPVNDERSVDLMVRLHTHLAAGVEPAEALAKASIGPDGELDPTAAPFICFGS